MGAGCLDRTEAIGMLTKVIDYEKCGLNYSFNSDLADFLLDAEIELVFLLGCIFKISLIDGINMYNVHPADPAKHGGSRMYGSTVYCQVLRDILDESSRSQSEVNSRHFTLLIIHEVGEKYNSGEIFIQVKTEVPKNLLISSFRKNI